VPESTTVPRAPRIYLLHDLTVHGYHQVYTDSAETVSLYMLFSHEKDMLISNTFLMQSTKKLFKKILKYVH
jgi:hypothetical protein